MRSPVSCELGTCSISSESSPSTIWGAAAIPPGLHEPVWAELDRHALRLFGPRRKPVREGQGLLRKQRRRPGPCGAHWPRPSPSRGQSGYASAPTVQGVH